MLALSTVWPAGACAGVLQRSWRDEGTERPGVVHVTCVVTPNYCRTWGEEADAKDFTG